MASPSLRVRDGEGTEVSEVSASGVRAGGAASAAVTEGAAEAAVTEGAVEAAVQARLLLPAAAVTTDGEESASDTDCTERAPLEPQGSSRWLDDAVAARVCSAGCAGGEGERSDDRNGDFSTGTSDSAEREGEADRSGRTAEGAPYTSASTSRSSASDDGR